MSADSSPTPQYPAAQLSVTPVSGPVGTPVIFSGSGFPPNAALAIYVDGLQLGVAASPARMITAGPQTDANGTFHVSGTMPEASYGDHSVCADTNNTWNVSPIAAKACNHFFVQPQISLSAFQGLPGAALLVKGTGFPAYETLALYIDNPNPPYFGGPPGPKADSQGTFSQDIYWPSSSQFFQRDPTTPGPHLVCGDTGAPLPLTDQPVKVKACATFIVGSAAAHVRLSPDSGLAGTAVEVTGDGFAPSSSYILDVDGHALLCTSNLGPVTTDEHGAVDAHITMDLRMHNQLCPAPEIVVGYGPHKVCVRTGPTISCATFDLLSPATAASPTTGTPASTTKPVAHIGLTSGWSGPLRLFAVGAGLGILLLLASAGAFWARRISADRGSLPPRS